MFELEYDAAEAAEAALTSSKLPTKNLAECFNSFLLSDSIRVDRLVCLLVMVMASPFATFENFTIQI